MCRLDPLLLTLCTLLPACSMTHCSEYVKTYDVWAKGNALNLRFKCRKGNALSDTTKVGDSTTITFDREADRGCAALAEA